jgi:hypothetical protein
VMAVTYHRSKHDAEVYAFGPEDGEMLHYSAPIDPADYGRHPDSWDDAELPNEYDCHGNRFADDFGWPLIWNGADWAVRA